MKWIQVLMLHLPFMVISCGPSEETLRDDKESKSKDILQKYESEFDPSEYNAPLKPVVSATDPAATPKPSVAPAQPSTEPTEVTQGYRVQLFSSTNIDEANAKKMEAEFLFPEERFYIVYHPPSYRLRAGNFLQKFDADVLAKKLAESGFQDSWAVPDKILRNPPPR